MGFKSNYDAKDYYGNMVDRMKKSVIKEINAASDKMWEEYFQILKNKAVEIFKNAVAEFYNGYDAKHANDRTYSMYDILEVEADAYHFHAEFLPEKMEGWQEHPTPGVQGFYHAEDGLYDTVFRHGWHGGASKIANSKIRQFGYYSHPNPGMPYWGWKTRRGYWTWGDPSIPELISPLRRIKIEWERFMDRDAPAIRERLRSKYYARIKPVWWR